MSQFGQWVVLIAAFVWMTLAVVAGLQFVDDGSRLGLFGMVMGLWAVMMLRLEVIAWKVGA